MKFFSVHFRFINKLPQKTCHWKDIIEMTQDAKDRNIICPVQMSV